MKPKNQRQVSVDDVELISYFHYFYLPDMKSKMTDDESNFWNVDLEVSLFHAMRSHKPVGKLCK